MDGELEGDSLSPEASAYFESRGETTTPEPAAAPAEPVQPATSDSGDDLAAQEAIEGRPQTQVPLRAVQEEREEKKRLRAELEEVRRTTAILEDRWNTLLKMGQQPQQQEQQPIEPPDPEKDIFAALKYEREQRMALEKRLEEKAQADTRTKQERDAEEKVWQFWESSTVEYAQTQTDFKDAATWLADLREKQLSALGAIDQRFASKQARDQQMNAELKEIVIAAAQQGKSPAELVYGLAKAYGYAGPKPAANADPAEAIAKIAANADAELSLSNVGGGAPNKTGPKSAEDVSNMSPAEFEAWLSKNGDAGFKRLMGGG